MLDLYLAWSEAEIQNSLLQPRLSLGGPVYWFLYRYFTLASLERGDFSFLNLWDDTELNGYQLHRLKSELQGALLDLSARPISFPVLVGWSGQVPCAEVEEWETVSRSQVECTVHALLELIDEAVRSGRTIFAVGD